MMGKSRSLFIKEYNHRLFNWLVAFSLVMVVIGRFFIKFILVEIGAWALFIFLETYTRMFWTAESLYYNPVWPGFKAGCSTSSASLTVLEVVVVALSSIVFWSFNMTSEMEAI